MHRVASTITNQRRRLKDNALNSPSFLFFHWKHLTSKTATIHGRKQTWTVTPSPGTLHSKTVSAFPHPHHDQGRPSLSPCSPPQPPWQKSRKTSTYYRGWATTRPPKGATSPSSSALPCQPFPPCVAMVFGSSPDSGTMVKYSHPWWVNLGELEDWDGEGQRTATKSNRDASPQPHWPLCLQKWGPGGSWGFCVSQLLVTRTHPYTGVSHRLNSFSRKRAHTHS